MDDQQRARELLATEYDRDGLFDSARFIRTNRMDPHLGWTRDVNAAIAAITAALRAAPEAVALRTAMTTLEQIASAPDDQGAKFNAMGALRFLQTQPVEFSAEPEGWSFQRQDDGSIIVTANGYGVVHVRPDDSDSIAAAMLHLLANDLAARPQGVKDAR